MLRLLAALVTGLAIRMTLLSFAIAIALPIPAFGQSTVSGGGAFTLVVKSDGTAWAFGLNNNGQLGDNSVTMRKWPKQIAGLSGIQAVAAGGVHSMALTSGGALYVWGDNFYNQVGDGFTTDRKVPVLLSLSNVVAIAAGEFHSLALTSDGKVYAWGRNNFGQAGAGAPSHVATPTVVINGGVVAIAAGRTHSLAVKNDGTVWAWGYNSRGQLGNGTSSTTAVNATPAAMGSVTGAVKVAGGEEHSLILLNDGTAQAVGENGLGQLGDTTTTDRSTAVAVSSLSAVTAVTAGLDQSFALLVDGTVRAWGDGDELGNGGSAAVTTPAQVTALSGMAAIEAGWNHTVAVSSNDVVSTWGSTNGSGQQGDGTINPQLSVTAISAAGFVWNTATPVLAPVGGNFTVNQNVSITTDTPAAIIRYTTDGTNPDDTDTQYAAAVLVDRSLIVKARAWVGSNVSGIATGTFALQVVQPTVSPAAATYTTPRTVTFATTTSGASIRYTTDGTTPTEASTLYTAPFQVAHTTTFKIAAFKAGWTSSVVRTSTYTMNFGTLSAPVIAPPDGTYTGSVTMTASTTAPGVVHYTTALGTTTPAAPSATSPTSTPITFTHSTKVRARSFHADYTTSVGEVTRTYTIKASPPQLDATGGSYAPGSAVTITSGDPTVDTLRMTIDGNDPTDTSPLIPSGTSILLGNFTLKVRAFRAAAYDIDSDVASATYTLNAPLGPGSVTAGGTHTVIATPDGRGVPSI